LPSTLRQLSTLGRIYRLEGEFGLWDASHPRQLGEMRLLRWFSLRLTRRLEPPTPWCNGTSTGVGLDEGGLHHPHPLVSLCPRLLRYRGRSWGRWLLLPRSIKGALLQPRPLGWCRALVPPASRAHGWRGPCGAHEHPPAGGLGLCCSFGRSTT
jgi:hypothetical protein